MRSNQAEEWQPLETTVPKDIFKAEVTTWAKKIGVEPRQLHVRPMITKWGSCSTAGRVTFDTELLAQPAHFRREVIVHELLHLKVPNHGRLFKALLKAYLGRHRNGDNPSVKRRPGNNKCCKEGTGISCFFRPKKARWPGFLRLNGQQKPDRGSGRTENTWPRGSP